MLENKKAALSVASIESGRGKTKNVAAFFRSRQDHNIELLDMQEDKVILHYEAALLCNEEEIINTEGGD